ncbi:MAG: phosphatase domain-containing protein [Ginsengibacter sp.]
MEINSPGKEKKIPLLKRLKHKIFFLFRLNNRPAIKVYNGFGNAQKIIVIGHVLKLSPMPRKTYRKNWITNFFSILRLFMVVPFSNAKIIVEWVGNTYYTEAEMDGFFRLEIFPEQEVKPGWQKVSVSLNEKRYHLRKIKGTGEVYIPSASHHAFISDIDDTFLISHSARLRKRLYVLFTKNARTRKPFAGVVNHYQLLASSNKNGYEANPFFYVSGSEWNLYDFIKEFSAANHLPKGVFLLSQMKRLSGFWRSGQNELSTKFVRITRIFEAFPNLHFVLLGDDSQQDPAIYLSIASHFPDKILAVYIRAVHKSNSKKTQSALDEIESKGIKCCYFIHSAEAIIHSKKIGLII